MKKSISFLLIAVLAISMIGCAVPESMELAVDSQTNMSDEQATMQATEEGVQELAQEPVAEQKNLAYDVVYTKGTVYTNSIGTTWLQAIVQIENTGNTALYVDSSSLDAENAEGKLVETMTYVSGYPVVLNPGETTLIVEETTLDSNPGVDTLTIIPHLSISEATVECIRFEVTEESLSEGTYGGIEMMGRVKNTSEKVENMVYVVANLFDADHHGIGQLFTILSNDLNPDEKIGFTLTALSSPDSLTLDSIASYELFAFPLQFQF